ncbi:MAG: hypothetical protein R6V83_09570 [Candidatus Thorarchaeota archaeon]
MSMKNTDFKTLLNDLKISLRFAAKNVISFILGMIGVLIVSALLLGVIVAVTFPVVILSAGMHRIIDFITTLRTVLGYMEGTAIMAIIAMIAVSALAPFLVAIGALFGMGREIVESAGTSAEGVFKWYKNKFFSLAGAGMLQFLILVLPVALLVMFPAQAPLPISSAGTFAITSTIGTAYFLIAGSILSMTFPAVIDGHGPIEAVKVSVGLSIDYVDRVFSTWLSYLAITVLLFAPIVVSIRGVVWSDSFSPVVAFMGIYGVVAVILLIFLVIPAAVIGLTRIYLILSGEERQIPEDEHPDINLVGDV